jgi:hypothetical protein
VHCFSPLKKFSFPLLHQKASRAILKALCKADAHDLIIQNNPRHCTLCGLQ